MLVFVVEIFIFMIVYLIMLFVGKVDLIGYLYFFKFFKGILLFIC